MQGTGPVTVDGVTVYAYFTDRPGGVVRVRVSADEWERLDLFPGRPVRVGLPGRGPADVWVTSATHLPPFVWVDLAPRPPAPPRAG